MNWAREIAEEWRWLFASASLPALTPATFNATVLEDDSSLWLVLFTDGTECGPCKTAQTNMLRLSAGKRPSETIETTSVQTQIKFSPGVVLTVARA